VANDTRLAGQIVACPHCAGHFQIPAAASLPVAPPTPVPAPDVPAHESRNQPDEYEAVRARPRYENGTPASHSLGIVSFVVGMLAFVVSLIPCVGAFSIPLSCLGLLMGTLGGIIAIFRHGHGIGYPIAGSAISLVALLFGLFWFGVMDATLRPVNALRPNGHDPLKGEIPAQLPMDEDAPNGRDIEDKWIDASQSPVQQGDVVVRITSAAVDFVNLDDFGRPSKSKNKMLLIHLTIENKSATKKVEYRGWGDTSDFLDHHAAKLKDNFGNVHHRTRWAFGLKVNGQVGRESIYPKKTTDDMLVFDVPVEAAEFLRLELPASAFGGFGTLRVQIPKSMIKIADKID
jgi:hypothetical protein